jgi:hypothetical protein
MKDKKLAPGSANSKSKKASSTRHSGEVGGGGRGRCRRPTRAAAAVGQASVEKVAGPIRTSGPEPLARSRRIFRAPAQPDSHVRHITVRITPGAPFSRCGDVSAGVMEFDQVIE